MNFSPPSYDPTLTRAVLGHLWRPQTVADVCRGTGLPYTPVKMALTRLQMAGLARRRRVTGIRGVYWMWEAA